jgi:membrane protease YdiL (CAAX protease family)
MHAITVSLRQHLHIVRSYPAAMVITLAVVFDVFYLGHYEHKIRQAIGYLFAVWLCALLTDIVVNLHPKRAIGFPIKYSATKEASLIFGCTLLGFAGLLIHFSRVGATWRGLERVSELALIVLFAFPIVLALIYLLLYRYRPGELGINLHYWYLPILIHILWGSVTFAVASPESHWHSYIQQNGFFWGVLFTGLITAALPEEFTRMLLQTRLGLAFRNKGLGFVTATFIWASLHIPVNHSQSPQASWVYVLVSSWSIMPLGFLWGYMTHRTKSLLPAVLLHGSNLWGLQNFG